MSQLTLRDVKEAAARIGDRIHRTPVLTAKTIDEEFGRPVFFKCENFQKVGAFKARGALNVLLNLPESVETVVTHSSGNHGAAVAWAAKLTGKTAYIICPTNASRFKRDAIVRYGGVIVDCGPAIEQRETALQAFLHDRKAEFVPPYDDPLIIAGQGTATLELLEEVPQLTQVWVPIGGGGLASGAVLAADQSCEVVGSEPELARDAHDSLVRGGIQPAMPPVTIADGLRSSLGRLNFDLLYRNRTKIHLVSEDAIKAAMVTIWNVLKIVIEPSSAVPVAAALKQIDHDGRPIGIILSGGNFVPGSSI